MRTTNTVFPALLVAFTALALCRTLAAGRQTEASSINAAEPVGVSDLQATNLLGDVDCISGVNAVDALKVLRHTIAIPVSQAPDCPPIGTGGPPLQGDVDCNNLIDLVDSLKILRWVSALSVIQTEPCPDIGT